MGKDQTTAADHPSTNDLASVFDPDAPHPPAYLTLGTTPLAFENPPNPGDTMTLIVKVRCKGFGGDLNADGKFIHKRKMVITSAWVKGTTPPADPNADQPAMIDEHGDPTADAATVTDSAPPEAGTDAAVDDHDAETASDEHGWPAGESMTPGDGIESLAAVIDGNPAFSHATVTGKAKTTKTPKAAE